MRLAVNTGPRTHRSWSSSPTTIYTPNIAASSPPSSLMVNVNANKNFFFSY
jgi:hypothetical protein